MHLLMVVPSFPNNYNFFSSCWLKNHFELLASEVKITVFVLHSQIHFLKLHYIKKWLSTFCKINYAVDHPNITIVPVKFWGLPGYFGFRELTFPLMKRAFEKKIMEFKDEKFDLVHAHFSSPTGYLAKALAKRWQIPLVITEHSGNFNFLIQKAVKAKKTLIEADYRIFVSEKQKEKISKTLGNILSPYTIIPMGVDEKKFSLKTLYYDLSSQVSFKILFVGGLVENKRVSDLIEVLNKLTKEKVKVFLTVVGDGCLKGSLENKVKQLNLESYIEFKGFLSPDELSKEYTNHDVFILPSYQESFGVVVIEALLSGLRVITSECGGPQDILGRGLGKTYPVGNIERLYQLIMEYRMTKDSIEKAIQRRDSIMKQFSQRVLNQKILDVYKLLLANRQNSR